jgi:hypothetical protein
MRSLIIATLLLSSNAYTAETVTYEGVYEVTCYFPSWTREFEKQIDDDTYRRLKFQCEINGGKSSYVDKYPWIEFVCLTNAKYPKKLRASGATDRDAIDALDNACSSYRDSECVEIKLSLDQAYRVEN